MGRGERFDVKRALIVVGALGVVVVVAGGILCKFVFDCGTGGGGSVAGKPVPLGDLISGGRGKTALPAGFSQQVVARGFVFPTSFAFLPDGRILVAQKNGIVKLVDHGVVAKTPFLDIRRKLNTQFFRGIVGIEVDPDFAQNHYVYVVYTAKGNPKRPKGPTYVRLSRFTASADSAPASSEKIVLGRVGRAPCDATPRADCLPSDVDHDGADISFAPDGTMFVSTGDGGGLEVVERPALLSQDVNYLGGKVLRVTRDGKGVPANPFWNGDPNANRSKVWAYGFRNPFRMTLRPGTEVPYVGEVGWDLHEEIDAVVRGGNYGWPCYEATYRTAHYSATPLCKGLYPKTSTLTMPVVQYRHPDGQSVTGGVFVTGKQYPAELQGAYVFGDWGRSWIRYVHVSAANQAEGAVQKFAENAAGPVQFREDATGTLYYLALNAGEVRRIVYTQP